MPPNIIGYNKNVDAIQPFAESIPGAPTSKLYHGLEISMDNRVVGRIRSWNPNAYSRGGNHVYELNRHSFGRPVDYVPSVAEGFTIAMARTEIWGEELEVAIGQVSSGNIWDDLTSQTRPFTIDERIYRGTTPYRHWKYTGCWFKEKNEEAVDAQGDGIYVVSCTIAYIQRVNVPV